MRKIDLNKLFFLALIIFIFLGILLLFPSMEKLTIKITEQLILNRSLRDHNKWFGVLLIISISLIFISSITIFSIIIKNKLIYTKRIIASEKTINFFRELNVYHLFILCFIFSLTFGIRVYWFTQKAGLHQDEVTSVASIPGKYLYQYRDYERNKAYTGKEIKDIFVNNDGSVLNSLDAIRSLWIDSNDGNHTNLYYSFIQIMMIGLTSFRNEFVILRGAILNLIFFLVSFIFFFLLLRLLFPNKIFLQFTALLCTFLSTITISNTIYLRPYQLQETMFIIFSYFFIKSITWKKYLFLNTKEIANKLVFPLAILTAFTLLTHYFALVYIILFGIYIILINIKINNYLEIKFYSLSFCLSLLFVQILYSKYFRFISVIKRTSQTNRAINYSLKSLMETINSVIRIFRYRFFSTPILLVCFFCFLYILFSNKKIFFGKPFLLFSISVVYSIIIIFVAPFKIVRYIMPIFPFLILLPILFINSLNNKKAEIIAMLLLIIPFFLNSINLEKIVDTSLQYYVKKRHIYATEPSIPVFIQRSGVFKDIFPWFIDDQLYYFVQNYEDLFLTQEKEIYLIYHEGSDFSKMDLADFSVENEFYFGFRHIGKKLIKIEN